MKTLQIENAPVKMRQGKRQGFVLITTLALFMLLTAVIVGLLGTTLADYTGANYHSKERQAFYQAEAGVRYVISRINEDIQAGTIDFSNTTVSVAYAAPAGFSFEEVHALTRLANGKWYSFAVTGMYENAKAVVEATVSRPRLMSDIGVFGNVDVRLQPNGSIYSYNADTLLNPTPADSTGQANVGSNEGITVLPGVDIDGLFSLGASEAGVPVDPPMGYDSVSVGRVDPDPLGMNGGGLEDLLIHYSNAANNHNAAAGIVDNTIDLGPHDSLTLTGGVYYIEEFYIGSGGTLNLEATTANPVILFVDGTFRAQPNSVINQNAGQPGNFYIFSRTDDEVRIQPNSTFRAFVYAPNAEIQLQPGGDIYGVYWGNSVRFQPHGDIYIDVSLLDDFLAANIKLEQWKRGL